MNTRHIIDTVIRSFGTPDAASLGGMSPDELATFTCLRELFLAAGAERIERETNPQRWLQVGLTFRDAEHAAAFMSEDLALRIEDWMSAGLITRSFSMNKPPGVRLRCCGQNLTGPFQDQLLSFLDRARAEGHISGHEFGVYSAETYQFGGERGMELCHDYFSYDSLAIMRLNSLRQRGELTADPTALSLLVVNDLVGKVVLDTWEHWDVWCNMRLARRHLELPADRSMARAQFRAQRPLLEAIVQRPDEVLANLGERERAWVCRYRAENARLAQALSQAERAGQLLYGLREVLPFCIVFHWNRLSLPASVQSVLAFYMQLILSPKASDQDDTDTESQA